MTTLASQFVVDESTGRLLELTSQNDRNEDDVEEIINLVNEKAPKLLETLSDSNKEIIAKTCYLKTYKNNEVVFQQGDIPDAYYTVIRGAISIYALLSTSTMVDGDDRTTKYGKFLMQLPPGSSFGELSFNADYNHSRRNAGVVSDGNHGGNHNEINASNVAILLLIPEVTYMDELYPRHASKHKTKEKVSNVITIVLRQCIHCGCVSLTQILDLVSQIIPIV